MARKKAAPATKAPPAKTKKLNQKIEKPAGKKKQKQKKDQQQQQDVELSQLSENAPSEQEGQQNEEQSSSGSGNSEDGSGDSNQDDQSQQSSSITPIKPENYAVKQMQFRQRRGTKMNYLMNRKKQQQQDPFWAEHKGYFGDLNGEDEEDQQDYVQESSGKDQFDSDFGQTQSQHGQDQEQQEGKKMVEQLDEQQIKQKKRRAELMKKVNAYKQKPTKTQVAQKPQKREKSIQQKAELQKTDAPIVKKQKIEKPQQQGTNRYIHQIFTQQQLLGEAAHTEYYNWLSLKKLISIETEKKDFTRKVKHLDGNKIIYKNKKNQQGISSTTYQLCGVTVDKVGDLTNYWLAK